VEAVEKQSLCMMSRGNHSVSESEQAGTVGHHSMNLRGTVANSKVIKAIAIRSYLLVWSCRSSSLSAARLEGAAGVYPVSLYSDSIILRDIHIKGSELSVRFPFTVISLESVFRFRCRSAQNLIGACGLLMVCAPASL